MKIGDYKVQGGKMLRIRLDLDANTIKSITILGDFFLHPESVIELIEEQLNGCRVDVEHITKEIQSVLEKNKAILIGASASDIANAIEKVAFSQE